MYVFLFLEKYKATNKDVFKNMHVSMYIENWTGTIKQSMQRNEKKNLCKSLKNKF